MDDTLTALQELGVPLRKAEVASVMVMFDEDGDGQMDMEELRILLLQLHHARQRDEAADAARMLAVRGRVKPRRCSTHEEAIAPWASAQKVWLAPRGRRRFLARPRAADRGEPLLDLGEIFLAPQLHVARPKLSIGDWLDAVCE